MQYLKIALFSSVILAVLATISITTLYIFKEPIIEVYNSTRPLVLSGGGEQCIADLKAKNVSFIKLGDIGTQECPRLNAVRVTTTLICGV